MHRSKGGENTVWVVEENGGLAPPQVECVGRRIVQFHECCDPWVHDNGEETHTKEACEVLKEVFFWFIPYSIH